MQTAPLPRLIVLAPSHFCERARWALDHMGIAHTETCWAPGPHVVQVKRIAPKAGLPILATGQDIIQGSDRILDWTGMPGGDPGLEQHFEQVIGPLVRQYLYAATLADRQSGIRDVLLDSVPHRQARLGRLLWPVTRRLMIGAMNARAELLPELQEQLTEQLEWFDRRVADRHYLAGKQFGRADITAASLLAPLLRPAVRPLYEKVRLPAAMEQTLIRWGGRPSLVWVRQMYSAHRQQSAPPPMTDMICCNATF